MTAGRTLKMVAVAASTTWIQTAFSRPSSAGGGGGMGGHPGMGGHHFHMGGGPGGNQSFSFQFG